MIHQGSFIYMIMITTLNMNCSITNSAPYRTVWTPRTHQHAQRDNLTSAHSTHEIPPLIISYIKIVENNEALQLGRPCWYRSWPQKSSLLSTAGSHHTTSRRVWSSHWSRKATEVKSDFNKDKYGTLILSRTRTAPVYYVGLLTPMTYQISSARAPLNTLS